MLSDTSKDFSKLTLAAEELIKAASSHVETTSLSIGRETVEGLKNLSISSSSIEKSLESLQKTFDSKMDILNESIGNLKAEIAKLNNAAALDSKIQRLNWAITNAEVNSFDYYEKTQGHRRLTSSELVKKILLWFKKGGFRILYLRFKVHG